MFGFTLIIFTLHIFHLFFMIMMFRVASRKCLWFKSNEKYGVVFLVQWYLYDALLFIFDIWRFYLKSEKHKQKTDDLNRKKYCVILKFSIKK